MVACPNCGCEDWIEIRRGDVTALCQCNVCGEQFRSAVAADGVPYTIQEVRSE